MTKRISRLLMVCILLSSLCPAAFAESLHGLTVHRQMVRVQGDDYEYMQYAPTHFSAKGTLSTIQQDLDGDGATEMLSIDMNQDQVSMTAYESVDGEWSVTANIPLYQIYLNCNIAANDVFLQQVDGRWMIFNEIWTQENSVADGAAWTLRVYEYNGAIFRQTEDMFIDGTDVSGDLNEWLTDFSWAEYRPELREIAQKILDFGFDVESVYWQSMICEQDIGPRILCRTMSVQDVPYETVYDFYTYGGNSLGGFRSFVVDCSRSGYQLPPEYFLSANRAPEGDYSAEDDCWEGSDPIDEYIIPDSDLRELTREELSEYDKDTLALIRNEILARYGYPFTKQKYRDYFESKSWYFRNEDFTYGMLTPLEMENIELIKKLEAK